MDDMDSTQALLDSTLPDTPDIVDSVIQDSEEDEIFFGNKSQKEERGAFAKSSRRDTLCMTDLDRERRRSFNVQGKKGRGSLFSENEIIGHKSSSGSSSLYSQENSIAEEDENEVFVESCSDEVVQVDEVSSTILDDGAELEIETHKLSAPTNVTGRRQRNRGNFKSLVSLPSASEIRDNIEVEVERSCGIDQHETIMPDLALALKDKESDLSRSLNPDDYQAQNDSSVDSAVDEMELMSLSPDKYVNEGLPDYPDLDHTAGASDENFGCAEKSVMISGVERLSNTSYANSTENSGVVTFKSLTSVSGVYDSFSDDTRDEFLQDTEVQEPTIERIDEAAYCNVENTEDIFTNVKKKIFDGESCMESLITADDADTVPFTLGRVSSGSGQFVLGSIDSDIADNGCFDSTTNGDDSVFSRSSQGGNSTLCYSFEVHETPSDSTKDDFEQKQENSELSTERNSEVEQSAKIPNIKVTTSSVESAPVDDARSRSPEFILASPRLSTVSTYHTAPTSLEASELSPMFDTTADEMMLYEMFGETYDEQVEAMSKEERVELKRMLQNRGDDEIQQVAEKLHKIMSEKERFSSIGSTMSPFSLANTPSFHLPKEPDLTTPEVTVANVPPVIEGSHPEPAFHNYQTAHYGRHTSASLSKIVARSPSPSPCKRTPWLPPSPSPKITSVVSPAKASLKPSRSLSKLPVPIPTTPRQVLGTPQTVSSTTPCSAKKTSRVDDIKAAFAAVASPVAEYVKSNPVPPLIQNVKGKSAMKDLESTLVEIEDKENIRRLSQLPPCPLPAAVYQAGTVAEEDIEYETGPEYAYIPEAYGTINSSAKVTKHVARIKVGAGQPIIKWNEDCLVNDESLQSTPSVARTKVPYKSVLKQTRRDSGLFDESMLEVSVHETKVVKKIARGKGRGRGRGKK